MRYELQHQEWSNDWRIYDTVKGRPVVTYHTPEGEILGRTMVEWLNARQNATDALAGEMVQS